MVDPNISEITNKIKREINFRDTAGPRSTTNKSIDINTKPDFKESGIFGRSEKTDDVLSNISASFTNRNLNRGSRDNATNFNNKYQTQKLITFATKPKLEWGNSRDLEVFDAASTSRMYPYEAQSESNTSKSFLFKARRHTDQARQSHSSVVNQSNASCVSPSQSSRQPYSSEVNNLNTFRLNR